MPLKVNLRDGRTLTFDLTSAQDLARWQASQSSPSFQRAITGLALHQGCLHTLSTPKRYRRIAYSAELLRDAAGLPVAERISCHADDTLASITLYFRQSPKLVRYDLSRVGTPRYVSRGNPWPQSAPE